MNTTIHHHRYAYYLEIFVVFFGILLVGMGIYQITNGQTTGQSDLLHSGYTDNQLEVNEAGGTGIPMANYGPVPEPGANGQVFYNTTSTTGGSSTTTGTRGRQTNRPTTTGGTTTGWGTTSPGGTGSSSYGTTTGGNYGQGGYFESGPVKNPGGYNFNKGVGSYGQGGVMEGGAMPTQGRIMPGSGQGTYGTKGIDDAPYNLVPATISNPTTGNVNFKNCAAFTKYHSLGDKGGDVGAIQMFLKEKGYYKGKIDGVYGIGTARAVKSFQKDYSEQILNPWGITNQKGTGIWYKSTTYKANKILGCPQQAVYLERVNKILEY